MDPSLQTPEFRVLAAELAPLLLVFAGLASDWGVFGCTLAAWSIFAGLKFAGRRSSSPYSLEKIPDAGCALAIVFGYLLGSVISVSTSSLAGHQYALLVVTGLLMLFSTVYGRYNDRKLSIAVVSIALPVAVFTGLFVSLAINASIAKRQ
jgi:hypothetical protein